MISTVNIPWERHRPTIMEDVILGPNAKDFFDNMTELPHLLLVGPPGCGKTTTALILSKKYANDEVLFINAAESGIDVVRGQVSSFLSHMGFGSMKVVILDEFGEMSKAAQDALKAKIEEHSENARFILTANSKNKITPAIQSRVITVEYDAPDKKTVYQYFANILKKEGYTVKREDKDVFCQFVDFYRAKTDYRGCVNALVLSLKDGVLNLKNALDVLNDLVTAFKSDIKHKDDVFLYREVYLLQEQSFNKDYYSLIQAFFDSYVAEKNFTKSYLCAKSLMEYDHTFDKEIHFFALICALVLE